MKDLIAFDWQRKCIEHILEREQDLSLMDSIYASVSGEYGTGKKYLGDGDKYFHFMERKWQITYYRMRKIEDEMSLLRRDKRIVSY